MMIRSGFRVVEYVQGNDGSLLNFEEGDVPVRLRRESNVPGDACV